MYSKLKKCKVKLWTAIVLFIMLALFPVIDSYAASGSYSSWITDSSDSPDYEEYTPDESVWDSSDTFSIDSITKHMSKNIMTFGVIINKIMYSGDNYGNITIDGLVLGRLAPRTWDFSIAQFGMEKGNPYGVIGAHVYVILRNVIYGFFLVYACWFLITQGMQNSSKAWISLKEGITGIVFAFFLTYLVPQLTSAFLFLRDVLMMSVSDQFSGVSNTTGSLNSFYVQMYLNDPDSGLVISVLFVALQFANLFFLGSYVTIAVQTGLLFGMFPAVAILSLKQKKLLSDWCALFFTNLAVPLIDYALLIIPTLITDATGTTNYVTAIVTLFVVWNIIPARTALLRLFGNATGTNAGRGMAGIGAMGMMMMRMMLTRGGGKGAAAAEGGNEGFLANLSNARTAQNEASVLGNTLSARGTEMQEVDKLMSSSGAEHSHASFAPAIDTLGQDDVSASSSVSTNASGSTDDSVNVAAEVDTVSGGGSGALSLEEGAVSGESYDIPPGAMDEEYVASGMSADGTVALNSMDMGGMYEPEYGVMNAGSMSDIDMEALKPQDVNMTFDDMRLRNLENMDNTQARIHQLETALPQAQETVAAYEKANAADSKAIANADNIVHENNETIRGLTTQNTQLKSSMSDGKHSAQDRIYIEKQIKENDQKIQQLRSDNTQQIALKESAQKSISARMPEYQKAQAAYEHHTTQLSAAKAAYGKQTMIERNFANAREITGGSGKVYESVAQFKDAHAMADVLKKNLSYRNFDLGDNARMLSPQEKADFYRQRAVVQASKKALGTAGAMYGGALGATAALFGGPGAMAMGGVAGGMAGNMVGKRVGEGITGTSYTATEGATPKEKPANPQTPVQQPVPEKRTRRFTNTAQQPSQKQQVPQSDIFQEHINMAKAGDTELNASRGKKMILHSDGKDSLQEIKKK